MFVGAKDLSWMSWKFTVVMRVTVKKGSEEGKQEKATVTAIINLLQVAIMLRDTEMVKIIIELVSNVSSSNSSMYDYGITFPPDDQETIKNLTFNCIWIRGACAVHLATFWHGESLAHLLKIDPDFGNKRTNNFNITPLHIAAVQENTLITRLLIHCKVEVDSKNFFGHTALHDASLFGSVNNVMILVFEGKANVLAKNEGGAMNPGCSLGETPLHHAKTGKIIRILLSKTTPQKLMEVDTIEGKPLFDQILKLQTATMSSYLDLMVTSKKDLEDDDPHLVFDLSMFSKDTKKEANEMDKHLKLMDDSHSKLLTHPVMKLKMLMKWHPSVVPYFINFLIFFTFLITFSGHALLTIDFLQCDVHIGSDGKYRRIWNIFSLKIQNTELKH